MFQQFEIFRRENKFIDIKIKDREQKMHCAHFIVLAASSKYLGELKTRSEFEKFDFDTNVCETILDFCYTEKVTLDEHNIEEIASAAKKWIIGKLLELCMKYMEDTLNQENCLKYLRILSLNEIDAIRDEPLKKEMERVRKVVINEIGIVISVDLGTTNTRVGVYRDDRVEQIPDDQGNKTIPTIVAFTADGEILFGDAAKAQQSTNPENTIYNFIRLIGLKFDDPAVKNHTKFHSYKIIEKDSKPHVQITTDRWEKVFAIEEITAKFLSHLKERAEKHLIESVKGAVVTISACSNDARRRSIVHIGKNAGFGNIKIINEPISVAVAYGLNEKVDKKIVLSVVFGGGSLDVSLLKFKEGEYTVIATSGDVNLGGEDFTQRVMNYVIESYKNRKGVDIRGDSKAMETLRREVEKSKSELSKPFVNEVKIESVDEIFTRAKFEELNKDLLKRIVESIENVLKDGGIKKESVDDILFTGGSSCIPKAQKLIIERFDGRVLIHEPLADAAFIGVTVISADISGKRVKNNVTLRDVNPLSLGVKDGLFDRMSVVIPRNTPIPTKKTETYTTLYNNQTSIICEVFEGEHEFVKNNSPLGKFELTGIIPAPAGVPEIDETFEINSNGILCVTAVDRETKNRNHIEIDYDHNRYTQEEIDLKIMNAELKG